MDGSSVAVKHLKAIGGDEHAHKVHKPPNMVRKLLTKAIQMMCREALVWRQLQHENVLPFIGINTTLFPSYRLPVLISPWMYYGSLREYTNLPTYDVNRSIYPLVSFLKSKCSLKLIRICVVQLRGMAQGIAYLHSLDITHGDLKHVRRAKSVYHTRH
jgi:serine/threonine protein kinase